ncbi:hypothetical protein [Sphaerisporangium sp. TRM90804]|uniref:hypothetical protein n=1 Tax=Sphaerisporangium sp. TRM90804 TaxID=3031113 RepID=UPI00244C85BB|nr:hypothetical protein [Sphaerisporangium sp. TRM90804]MDH2427075.1 hypothetical protein [Sphaerisporangium sp. TRM90804]
MISPEDDGLEAELRALGLSLDVPTPPPADVAASVRARLEGSLPHDAPAPVRRARRRVRRWVATGVAVLVAVLLGVTPQGQAAVQRVLRFAGVELRIGDPAPVPSGVPSPLPGERRVSLREAREAVAFPVLVPAELGEPRDVRVSDGGRVVSLYWPGARLDAYDGTLSVVWRKELGPPWPDDVTVSGEPGTWIPGRHSLTYIPRQGSGTRTYDRLAAPTLIWQVDAIGYRLEGPKTFEQARRIAASLR